MYRYFKERHAKVFGLSIENCDLLNPRQIKRNFKKLPERFHVVFASAVARRTQDTPASMIANIRMTHNFLSAIGARRLSSLIYLSSADVYGAGPALPITESSLPVPSSFYAISKYVCERLLLSRRGFEKIPITVLRLPGVYGCGDHGQSVVGQIAGQLAGNGRVRIIDNLRRDYLYIDDLCRVVHRALLEPRRGVLNAATGRSLSLRKIAAIAAKALRLEPVIEIMSSDGYNASLKFDIRALRRRFKQISFLKPSEAIAAYIKKEINHG
ncbi:MAG: SDR family oxidoreductase [Elusimicrobia bacterium]|nr:SDR family oxidoreductase [Elusimicrobiota bacterium]